LSILDVAITNVFQPVSHCNIAMLKCMQAYVLFAEYCCKIALPVVCFICFNL